MFLPYRFRFLDHLGQRGSQTLRDGIRHVQAGIALVPLDQADHFGGDVGTFGKGFLRDFFWARYFRKTVANGFAMSLCRIRAVCLTLEQ
jgi:hypothetical protein